MLTVTLSFWVTDADIPLNRLDSAESLLVKIRQAFLDLYMAQGVNYRSFCLRALKALSAVEINAKIVPQSVNKTVEAYSRVYDILKEHREHVIEAFLRKSSFDTGAALILLKRCEMRRYRGDKATLPDYPDDMDYEIPAQCANDFAVFSNPISGRDLIDFRDASLLIPLTASNMARAVFFLSLLEKLRFLPRNWKSRAVNKRMLINSKTGKAPTLRYLYSSADRNSVEQYLADESSARYFSRESFYIKIARAVKLAIRRK